MFLVDKKIKKLSYKETTLNHVGHGYLTIMYAISNLSQLNKISEQYIIES